MGSVVVVGKVVQGEFEFVMKGNSMKERSPMLRPKFRNKLRSLRSKSWVQRLSCSVAPSSPMSRNSTSDFGVGDEERERERRSD